MDNQKRFLEGVCSQEPEINVVDKETMDMRTAEVFDQIAEALRKSFGPLGSHTVISRGNYYHVTKDGFTIMKNIRYNSEYGYLDNVIMYMISDICARLNYAVGDGTTSAVIAANALYQTFRMMDEPLKRAFFLPRNVIACTKEMVDKVIEELNQSAINIREMNEEEMLSYIEKVVFISSNGDVEMTKIITDLYRDLKFPAITVEKSDDGYSRGVIADGFKFPAHLTDRLYINTQNDTQEGENYDVLIFDHRVDSVCYNKIIAPLHDLCRSRRRKLIILAPYYEEQCLQGEVANVLNQEYKITKNITLVMMQYTNSTAIDQKRARDLAMLCNTSLITKHIERDIIRYMDEAAMANGNKFIPENFLPIDIDNRAIPGMLVRTTQADILKMDEPSALSPWYEGYKADWTIPSEDMILALGYVGKATLGLGKDSIFSGFCYDKDLYEKYVEEAENDLNAAIEKYKRLGTFNTEISSCQKRLFGLRMKVGTFEVGSTSDFSQDFAKDAADDAVKAAESAFNNGIILGGHIALLNAIDKVIERYGKESKEGLLLEVFKSAFVMVRFSVFMNGWDVESLQNEDAAEELSERLKDIWQAGNLAQDDAIDRIFKEVEVFLSEKLDVTILFSDEIKTDRASRIRMTEIFGQYLAETFNGDREAGGVFDLILYIEQNLKCCLDINMKNGFNPVIYFDWNVINSTATDKEILIAATDLAGLLYTSNQHIIATPNL